MKKSEELFKADLDLTGNKKRLNLINRMVDKLFFEGNTEKNALPVFLWYLADIDPPLKHDEIKVFRALYRIRSSYSNCDIGSKEEALKILGLSANELDSPTDELIKKAKRLYWQYYHNTSSNPINFITHSLELGRKKKAVSTLTNSHWD